MDEQFPEEYLGEIGFMFDASHQKIDLLVELNGNIIVNLRTIGTDPGHKQSGQYLWPAASFLANYLIDHWEELGPKSLVCELGSGCGLSGIAAVLLGADRIIFTDYDSGALTLIKGNRSHHCT